MLAVYLRGYSFLNLSCFLTFGLASVRRPCIVIIILVFSIFLDRRSGSYAWADRDRWGPLLSVIAMPAIGYGHSEPPIDMVLLGR